MKAPVARPSHFETPKMRHAQGLYLDGIRDGNIHEALAAHTGARYTQHSTGVQDGQAGFAAFFEPFIRNYPERDIQVIRAIEDGPYVFLHVYQNLNHGAAKWVTADLFDTDAEDRVIEHWDVIQAYAEETVSGRSMIDGPTALEDLDLTDANKSTIAAFCDTVLIGGDFARASEFVSTETYHQHNPQVADGLEALTAFSDGLAAQGTPMRYWKIHKLIGQGNFVVTLGHMQMGQSHFCVFDIFRLSGGKIVEHWDVIEKILAPEEWNNQGKF